MRPSHSSKHGKHGGSSCLGELLSTALLALLLITLLGIAFSAGFAGAEPGTSEDCQVSSRFPHKVRRWCDLITSNAHQANLPPDLVAAVIWQESGGNPNAYSHSGAVGLMQVMPRDGLAANFRCKGKPCFEDRPTIVELKDPEFNLHYGTRMLSSLARKYNGDMREALRAYGPMDMGYRYADIILSLYKKYGKR